MAPLNFHRSKVRARQASGAIAPHKSKLTFEKLESRQLLAADMAEILGEVRVDPQGDGNVGNDTVVAGAIATLYRDGGNGTFDGGSGDDTVVGSSTTDAAGKYQFQGVGAGNYFVKIAPPSDLQFRPGDDVQAVTITADEGDGVSGPTIDGFASMQMVEASPPLPASEPSHLTDADVLGGERDMFVELTEGTDPFSSVSLISGAGLLRLASDTTVTGNAKIVWDGADGNALSVNATGLGGIDMTQADGNTMTGIALTSGADHPNSKITMRVYSDANNWSEFTTTVPESLGGAATGQAVFNFDDVPTASAGQGADFTNVGALELTFEGVTAVDGQVSLIGLLGRATKRLDFTASPRLSVGDQVWADIDDDGIFEGGESAIAGVKLNLYQDTDGDNQYSASVDQLLGTTTTDANGRYLFTDLFPGRYVVQVDPTNFQSTGPLANLVSSSGNDPASDPDDNVDHDDNGTSQAGAGVVSQAVTLSGVSAANRTVDFGFFGFDLFLDKAVQQTSLSPTETVEYTIKVDNAGPSAAENTSFEDVLPDDVTFVSGTTSLPGVGVQHVGGVVTADLGTLQPGATVFVTIIGTVDASATGTLVNTATVIAPKEVDLSNNTDTVSNPVVPRIDLAIDKSDSRDPVEPGGTFSYVLDVTNHGPSHATGVVVTDELPGTGVSYVGASVTPATISGDTLTFDVGNLAAGASLSITIDVRVDDNFVGQLLNYAEVQGNEQEITLANNEATETTLVQFDPASVGGSVFVDRDDDGVFDAGERALANVIITLKGTDVTGATVVRTTTTASDGSYLFDDLNPGTYRIEETQPAYYNDGKEHLGTHGGATGTNPGQLLVPQDVEPSQLQDLFFNIQLGNGDEASKYDFGELAITFSKRSFLAR